MNNPPLEELIRCAIHEEVDSTKNPYVTLETIILRLYKKIFDYTHVYPNYNDKTLLFQNWHDEILTTYESIRSSLSHDERASIERVLSKDCPHPTELIKFACCFHKYNPTLACKWFAVDGILGTHPKMYVHEAFCASFAKHASAVRALYAYHSNPEKIKEIIEKAFLLNEGDPCPPNLDLDFERSVALYAEMVGEEEMRRMSNDRKSRVQQQQQPGKRKKTPLAPASPQHV